MGRWSYWIKSGCQNSLILFLACLFYGIFMATFSEHFSLNETADTAYQYATVFGSMILVIMNVTKIPFVANTILSFGETRKNCVKGITLMNAITIILNSFVVTLFGMIAYRNIIVLFATLIIFPSISLIANGLSILICSINKALSNPAGGLQTVLMILALPFVAVLQLITSTNLVETMEYKSTFIQVATVSSLILGLILTVAGTCLLKKRVMQLEVKL